MSCTIPIPCYIYRACTSRNWLGMKDLHIRGLSLVSILYPDLKPHPQTFRMHAYLNLGVGFGVWVCCVCDECTYVCTCMHGKEGVLSAREIKDRGYSQTSEVPLKPPMFGTQGKKCNFSALLAATRVQSCYKLCLGLCCHSGFLQEADLSNSFMERDGIQHIWLRA